MRSAFFALIAGCSLAACVSDGPRQSATEVTFSSQSTDPLFGYDETIVQVVAPKDLSKFISRIEPRSGVPCTLQGANYSARLVTPAKVLLPDYGPKSKPVTVTCTYQGVTRTATVSAFDATAAAAGREAGGNSNTLGGVLVGALAESIVSIDRKGKNDWTYPGIEVRYSSRATN